MAKKVPAPGPFFAVPSWEGWRVMKKYHAIEGLRPAGVDFVERYRTKKVAMKDAADLNEEYVAKHGPWVD